MHPWASAGTTGGISGVVTETGTTTPIAGATVTVTSPSQSASTTTDAHGHFAFVSLAPDEYTVALQKTGYEPLSYAGVAVLADAQQTLTLSMRVALRTIANVTSRSAASLVKPGTTADIYSINAAQQARTAVLGGGGDLNSAYSAIASVPGAYVPGNQNGYNQAVHIRGGDASEVGYEFDGIPVNRAFDNYPSGSLSSLGQLELQVYTGATPANAEAQGLAGFINQVIKTGTFPGYAAANVSAGTPIFYHSLNVEVGGATPDRMFSYYVGIGGYNQDYRYVDQFGGAAYANEFGQQLGQCPSAKDLPGSGLPSCYTNGAPNVGTNGSPGWILGPIGFGTVDAANIATRTAIMNFHIAIPHKNDSLRDDIQLLYDNDEIFTTFFSSVNDEGYSNWINTVGTLSAVLSRYLAVQGPARHVLADELRVARNAVLLSLVAGASVRRPYSRSEQSARPRLQRSGDRQAAIPKELQLQRLPARLRLHVLLRLDRERADDVAAALRVLRLRRLRDQQPHARRQRQLHRPAQPAGSPRGGGIVHDRRPARASTTSRCSNTVPPTAMRLPCWSTGTIHSAAPAITCTAAALRMRRRRRARDGQASGVTYGSLPTFLVLSNPTAHSTSAA